MFQIVLAAMLQLMLCAVAEAAPIQAESNSWQYGTGGGVLGFIVLVLDIMAWSKQALFGFHTRLFGQTFRPAS
jgi:hypothetical protein